MWALPLFAISSPITRLAVDQDESQIYSTANNIPVAAMVIVV
jgi:hypothetical protein